MKRYVLGFLGAYLLAALATVGMATLTILWWFFVTPSLWFQGLFVIMTLLPFFLSGAWNGDGRRYGLVSLFAAALVPVLLFCLPVDRGFLLLGLPGVMLGDLMARKPFWEVILFLFFNFLMPLLYHFGWKLRKAHNQ